MTNISRHDLYPSTYDTPKLFPIAGAQDAVLATEEEALARLEVGWTGRAYVDTYKDPDTGKTVTETCAIGAVLAAEGIKNEGEVRGPISLYVEQELAEHAKQAIRELDETAVELFPWSEDYHEQDWMGPLEYVNQCEDPPTSELDEFDEEDQPQKERVLAIYRRTIEKRKALVTA
jgi:hypothetical protein